MSKSELIREGDLPAILRKWHRWNKRKITGNDFAFFFEQAFKTELFPKLKVKRVHLCWICNKSPSIYNRKGNPCQKCLDAPQIKTGLTAKDLEVEKDGS